MCCRFVIVSGFACRVGPVGLQATGPTAGSISVVSQVTVTRITIYKGLILFHVGLTSIKHSTKQPVNKATCMKLI